MKSLFQAGFDNCNLLYTEMSIVFFISTSVDMITRISRAFSQISHLFVFYTNDYIIQ